MKKQINSVKRKSSEKFVSSDFSLILINVFIHLLIFILITIISYLSALKFDFLCIISLFSTAISNFLSGMLSGFTKRQNGLINGILFSLPSSVVFIILSLITNKFHFDYMIIVSITVAVFFSAIGGIIAVNFKRKIKIRH